MFDNLPDGASIEDLFCDDPNLLEPLLATTNILSDDIPPIKPSPVQCKQLMLHRSELPLKNPSLDIDNHLLEQLMNDVGKVDQSSVQVNSRK